MCSEKQKKAYTRLIYFQTCDILKPKRKEVITMPRTKGSKNRPKTNTTKDYATPIAEKQEQITTLTTESVSIQKVIEEQKNTLKEMRKSKTICVMSFKLRCQKLLTKLSFILEMFVICSLVKMQCIE